MMGCDSGFELRWSGSARLDDAVVASLRALDAMALAPAHRNRLAVIIEELLANQWDHGAGEAGMITLRAQRAADHLLLVLEDAGAVFDPRKATLDRGPVPDRGGGAGLALIRAWSQSLNYHAGPPINRLELRYGLSD